MLVRSDYALADSGIGDTVVAVTKGQAPLSTAPHAAILEEVVFLWVWEPKRHEVALPEPRPSATQKIAASKSSDDGHKASLVLAITFAPKDFGFSGSSLHSVTVVRLRTCG